MSQKLNDVMCKALEMAERAVEFYESAVGDCPQGIGKEVFQSLLDDEADHLTRIREIQEGLAQGESFEAACTLDEEDRANVVQAFRQLTEEYEHAEACTAEEDALKTGIDLEQTALDFYENWLDEAEESKEREFAEQMVEDKRAHLNVLQDLQYYFEDPEGWALSTGKGGLDGA
jgi:rubrerythrin